MNGGKEFLLIMKINKNVIKKAGVGLFSLTLGLGALGGGYYLSQNGVSAEQQNVATVDEEVVDKVKSQIVNANILNALFSKLDSAEKSGTQLSQEELDGYSYYMITYYESGQTYYSDGVIGTPFEGLARLENLYKLSNLEPSFKWIVTNSEQDLQKLVLTRDLHKPDNFDVIVEDVKQQVDEKSDEILTEDKTDVKEIEVDVNESKLLEGN